MKGETSGRSAANPTIHPRGVQRARTLLCQSVVVALIACLSVGCPTMLQHQANERLVDELGVPQARQRLQDTLTRSLNPQITQVEINDDSLYYRYNQPVHGPYGIVVGMRTAENRIFFNNVHRVDVFENGVVLVRAQAENIIGQLIFSNTDDSRRFADLLTSFRTYRERTVR